MIVPLLRPLIAFVCLISALFYGPVFLWAQDQNRESARPGLTVSVDRSSARVGGSVVLTLDYHLPEGAAIPEQPEIKGLEELSVAGREMGPGQIKITILIDRLGSWETGPISLSYSDSNGDIQTLSADPLSVTVLSNLGDRPEEAELKPIQDIMSTRILWLKHWPWGAGLLAILLLIFGLAWWSQKRRREISEKSAAPPHVLAKTEIESLEAQGIFEKGHFKVFYFRFSEILRRYLESLRGFPAAEFTTEEIAHHVDNETDRNLIPLLRQADLVKFADVVPTPARKDEEVKAALSYIRETGPAVETDHREGDSKGAVK